MRLTVIASLRNWNYVARFFTATMATFAAVALFNYAVDPLQLFGPSRFFPAWYSPNDREQAAGLIQSQNFDAVLMGTSLAIHHRASDVSKRFGVHAVKLAMAGSTSKEQSFVLAAALEKKPKLVIWQMDDWIFRNAPDVDSNIYMPADLYRRNIKGVAGYLLSLSTIRESAAIVARTIKPLDQLVLRLTWINFVKYREDNADDINQGVPSYNIPAEFNRRRAMAEYAAVGANPVVLSSGFDYSSMVSNFESDAVSLIKAHPDTRFKIYITPYSILYFAALRDFSPATLDLTYRVTAYMAERLTQLPNVELYDFRADDRITHNLDNYRDIVHHSPVIDQEIMDRMARGEGRVTADAPLKSLDLLKQQVAAYHVTASPE
jgi:hypothetical protein